MPLVRPLAAKFMACRLRGARIPCSTTLQAILEGRLLQLGSRSGIRRLKDKISVWDELSTIYMAAQVLGYDKPDPNHVYNLTDA